MHDKDQLALQIVEWMNSRGLASPENAAPRHWFVDCFDNERRKLGWSSPHTLLLALMRGDIIVDMGNDEAGGSIPVELQQVCTIYCYVG